jgi:hypothetical protein
LNFKRCAYILDFENCYIYSTYILYIFYLYIKNGSGKKLRFFLALSLSLPLHSLFIKLTEPNRRLSIAFAKGLTIHTTVFYFIRIFYYVILGEGGDLEVPKKTKVKFHNFECRIVVWGWSGGVL